MKHPSQYSTIPFNGLHVMFVDAGTVIKDQISGEEVTVTDTTCATKGSVVYVTKTVFDALKAHVPEA